MLLEVAQVSEVAASPEAAWLLIRDVPRLAACIPSVSDLQEQEPDHRYSAVVTERLGPFKLQVPVQIELLSINPPHGITAELTGNESHGQARVKGLLEADVQASDRGTRLSFNMRMEVLGKLATLGAAPMRRKADQIFSEFVERVRRELAVETAPR